MCVIVSWITDDLILLLRIVICLTHCMLGNFAYFYCRLQIFWKILSGTQPECQIVWIQIRPDILLGLIWFQIVCKSYQQTTLVGKALWKLICESNSFPVCADFCSLLITFANCLDPDQAGQNAWPDLDPNCLTLWWLLLKDLLTFANSLDPGQAQWFVGPDLDPKCLTLRWYYWKKFLKKKMILKKISRRQISMHNYSACEVNIRSEKKNILLVNRNETFSVTIFWF